MKYMFTITEIFKNGKKKKRGCSFEVFCSRCFAVDGTAVL